MSYCKVRPEGLRGSTLSRHVLDGRFYRQMLVTAVLHTFPSLVSPRSESVFKHIQTPAERSFIATGAPEYC